MPHNAQKPDETEALYRRLRDTPNLPGSLSYDGRMIHWRFHKRLCLDIALDNGDGYIGISGHMPHFHPDVEEIFEELLSISRREVVFVSKLGLFGRYYSAFFPKPYFEKHRWWITLGLDVRCETSLGVIK